MALPEEPYSYYRDILVENRITPLFRMKSLPTINVYPYQPNIIYGEYDIEPNEGRCPVVTEKSLSGTTRVEKSVKSAVSVLGEESLEVSVVKREGNILTFEAVKRAPVIREPGITIDYFIRMRPVAVSIEDTDLGYYKADKEEGWNDQGLLYLNSPSGTETFGSSMEYGFCFQEGGSVDRVMVRHLLSQGLEAGGILVNSAVRIINVNSKTIEGYTASPKNSYFCITRGDRIKSGDFDISYGKEEDAIDLYSVEMDFPYFIHVSLPESSRNLWKEFSHALRSDQQERPEVMQQLLNEWNTRLDFNKYP